MEYGSSSYRFDLTTTGGEQFDYAFNHSELLTLLRLEQRFAPWVWGNLRFGYQTNFSTDFESKSLATPEFMVDPSNGLFFEIGIFISPPDHFRHDCLNHFFSSGCVRGKWIRRDRFIHIRHILFRHESLTPLDTYGNE